MVSLVTRWRSEVDDVDLLQAWMIVGVPALAVVFGLFAGRSKLRATVGYVLLLALVLLFVATPGGGLSAAAIGLLAAFFVATGRGTDTDREYLEHHEERKRFTTTAGSEGS